MPPAKKAKKGGKKPKTRKGEVSRTKAKSASTERDVSKKLSPVESDIVKVTELVQNAVDRGYWPDAPESLLAMLMNVAPSSLVEFKEDRHRFQNEMNTILGIELNAIKGRMDANLAEMNATQASADDVKAGLETKRDEAEAALNAANLDFNNKKEDMTAKIADAKTKHKTLVDLNNVLDDKREALADLTSDKAKLDDIFNVHFKFLTVAPAPEPEVAAEPVNNDEQAETAPIVEEPVVEAAPPARKLVRKTSKKLVMDKVKELCLEISCVDTLKSVLNKDPADFDNFEKQTVAYAERWFLQQIAGLANQITEKNTSITQSETEIATATTVLEEAQTLRIHATEDLETAKTTRSTALEAKKMSEKDIRTHVQTHKELADQLVKKNKWLAELNMCIICFNMLVERSKPVPVVEPEPVAPAADVVMAEA